MKTSLWLLAGGATLYLISKIISRSLKQFTLSSKAKAFLSKAHPSLPDVPSVSREKQLLILTSSATRLAELIREGRITSVEAVAVYVLQAYSQGRRLHLNAGEDFAAALAQAAVCDEQLKANPSSCGRLHGVPICVKDVFAECGKVATCGVSRLTSEKQKEDALVIQVLKSHGAIPFLRSSVPQAVDWVETENLIFGRGENPWAAERSCGGCAEAGLVVSQSTPIALSVDARDSLQLGCAFNGAFGIRLTPERVSRLGLKHSHSSGVSPYEWLTNSSIGVVGKSSEDLATVCQLWWTDDMFRKDMGVPDLPFDPQKFRESQRLTIGVFSSNGQVEPIAGAASRLAAVTKKLKELGFTVVEFSLPSPADLLRQTNNTVHSYMDKAIDESLMGERNIEAYSELKSFLSMRRHNSICRLLLRMKGEKRLAEHLKLPLLKTSAQTISVYYVVRDYRIALAKAWQDAGVDLVLCPTWPLPAPRHGEVQNVMMALSYSTLWNLMGFPVGIVPTGPLTKDELKYESTEKDSLAAGCKKICEGAEGLPFALSVVGLPFTDERVLGFMQVLESAGLSKFTPAISLS